VGYLEYRYLARRTRRWYNYFILVKITVDATVDALANAVPVSEED